MTDTIPPTDYDELIRIIHSRYDAMSRSYQRIAEFLTQNPNDVAVMSVNAIAKDCGIHASNFVRFAQSLGYPGFKDLQGLFQRRLSSSVAGFEARFRALEADLSQNAPNGPDAFLHNLVVRDIAALQDLALNVQPDQISEAADRLERAETIYLLGQLRSLPAVTFLQYMLTMIGKPNVLLGEGGGLASHRAKMATQKDLLFVVSFRFYATEVVSIAEQTAGRGVPIIAVSDSTLSPLAKTADQLFAVPEHQYTFSRSLAAPMCLAQAIVVALAARLQHRGSPRIPTVTQP